jgi:hypothetical protein
VRLLVCDAAAGRAACPVSVREFAGEPDLLTPYGYSGFAATGRVPGLPERWRAFAADAGFVCGYVALNPMLPVAAQWPAPEVHCHNHVLALDLTRSDSALWAGLSTNRRRQLRDWHSVRERLILDQERLARFLVREYPGFMERHGAGSAYRMDPAGLARLCALDSTFLVGAGRGTALEAVSLFASTPHAGEFVFNVSTPGGEHHSAALIWYAVGRLRESGVRVLNLGGGVRDGDRLYEFKRRFGGTRLPLTSLRQVYRADAYRRLCDTAGVSANPSAGFFPPYHAARAQPAPADAAPSASPVTA